MTDSIRLAKRVAELAPCSRGEAEQYIANGAVTVDGVVVEEPGFRVLLGQQVVLLPDASLAPVEPVTILLHKPVGVVAQAAPEAAVLPVLELITAATLAADDRSGNRFLKRHLAKLTLTSPLETEASGLVVLTQDWRIVRKLVDDAVRIEQEFIVEVAGEMRADGLELLNAGVSWNGKPVRSMKVSWQNEKRLRFALKNPQPGQIAHMCRQVGLSVVALRRIRIGRLPLAGLAVGEWRYLLGYEQF